jgi:hypothetical protein
VHPIRVVEAMVRMVTLVSVVDWVVGVVVVVDRVVDKKVLHVEPQQNGLVVIRMSLSQVTP